MPVASAPTNAVPAQAPMLQVKAAFARLQGRKFGLVGVHAAPVEILAVARSRAARVNVLGGVVAVLDRRVAVAGGEVITPDAPDNPRTRGQGIAVRRAGVDRDAVGLGEHAGLGITGKGRVVDIREGRGFRRGRASAVLGVVVGYGDDVDVTVARVVVPGHVAAVRGPG